MGLPGPGCYFDPGPLFFQGPYYPLLEVSIQFSVADGFAEMGNGDAVFAGQIGDGAGELKYAVIGSVRESKFVDGFFQ